MLYKIREFDFGEEIDLKEFLILIETQLSNGYSDEELDKFFSTIDVTNKNVISVNDIMMMMSQLDEKITREEAEQMILEADVDNDGVVNFNGNYFCLLEKIGKTQSPKTCGVDLEVDWLTQPGVVDPKWST